MTTQTVTTIPYAEKQTTSLDLPNGAPDVPNGAMSIAPTRITIRYAQLATSPIPRSIEVTVKGLFRFDGELSPLGNAFVLDEPEWPAWVRVLVTDNLPAWWTA